MPPGERRPAQTGVDLPSGEILNAQPRYGLSLLKEPVRHSATHRSPFLSNFEPKAYSW